MPVTTNSRAVACVKIQMMATIASAGTIFIPGKLKGWAPSARTSRGLVSPTEGRFVGPSDNALAKLGRTRSVALSVSGFLIVPDILQTGDLIAVVPERALHGRMTGLRTFEPPLEIPGFGVIALWHPRLNADPAHRWLRELLVNVARELKLSATLN